MSKRKSATILDFWGAKKSKDGNDGEGEKDEAEASCSSSTANIATGTGTADEGKNEKQSGREFQESWKGDFEWLEKDDNAGLVFCKYCRDNKSNAGKSKLATGIKGRMKRETLVKHSESKHHQRCVSISKRPNVRESAIAVEFAKVNEAHQEKTDFELDVKMNTAYCIAKEEMSFTKMKPLLLLQKKNGLDITPTYANHVRCKEMVSTIASVQKCDTKDAIAKNNDYLSIMFDGATNYTVNENEVIYARVMEDGKPVNRLIGLTKVENANADGLVNCIKSTFENFELPDWNDRLVGMCADGASVNLGQSGGVVAKLRESSPHLIDIHCMAHRLELALLDVQKSVNMVQKVDETLNSIYKTYHKSPKSKRELEVLCNELETRIYSPKPVKGTRWVPHIDRALKQFIKSNTDLVKEPGCYSAVQMHMESLTTSKEAAMAGRAKKVAKQMVQLPFVAFCHFLADLFEQVANLSLEFQKEDLMLPSAVNSLDDCVATLTSMKTEPLSGGMLEKLVECFSTDKQNLQREDQPIKFQGLELTGKFTDSDDLLGDLSECMEEAIDVTLSELDKRFSNLLGKNPDSEAQNVVKAFTTFHHDKWPESKNALLEYGNKDIKRLLNWFNPMLQKFGCETDKVLAEWRKLKLLVKSNFSAKPYPELYQMLLTKSPYKDDHENLLHLVKIMLVLPISSANCERAFSAQKRIVTANRSSMAVTTASDLILISTEGPELSSFDPGKAVTKWKEDKNRRPTYKESWDEEIVCTLSPPPPSSLPSSSHKSRNN